MGGTGSRLLKSFPDSKGKSRSTGQLTGADHSSSHGEELTAGAVVGCYPRATRSVSVKTSSFKRALAHKLAYTKDKSELESSAEVIPGLPLDELALLCLAHVPLGSMPVLRSVCKQWRSLVDNGELFQARKQAGVAEAWLFAVEWGALGSQEMFANLWAFDTLSARWINLDRLPSMHKLTPGSRMVGIGTSLYFLGGASPPDEFDRFLPTSEVWRYDLLQKKAFKARSMITPRDRFASAVIGGKLYVAGGLGAGFNYAHESLLSAEVYDPVTDTWQALPDMPSDASRMPALECQGATVKGKFYVRSSYNRSLADIFDPESKKWTTDPNFFPLDSNSAFYTRLESGENCMYMLDTVSQPSAKRTNELRVFDGQKKTWACVAKLPVGGFVGAVSLVGVGDKIYLAGGEDPRSDPYEAWASRLPFNGRLGKLMAEPCLHVFHSESGEGKWEAKNPPQYGVITRWLGTCTAVEV